MVQDGEPARPAGTINNSRSHNHFSSLGTHCHTWRLVTDAWEEWVDHLSVPPTLEPMSDMPGVAVAAVVDAQLVRKRTCGYQASQVSGGITLPSVYLLAGACSHLGSARGHSEPSLFRNVRQICILGTALGCHPLVKLVEMIRP